jgi:hypothetical protein
MHQRHVRTALPKAAHPIAQQPVQQPVLQVPHQVDLQGVGHQAEVETAEGTAVRLRQSMPHTNDTETDVVERATDGRFGKSAGLTSWISRLFPLR